MEQIILSSDAVLEIFGGVIACRDRDGIPQHLTPAQRKILKKLVESEQYQADYAALYKSYATGDPVGTQDLVNKMKDKLPACVKESVESIRGYGYQLLVKTALPLEEQLHAAADGDSSEKGNFAGLAGDYYGYYLDPLGSGAVLGGYIHIENTRDCHAAELNVYAIMDIHSDEVLLSEDIAAVFRQRGSGCKEAFDLMEDTLHHNDGGCFWGQGKVEADESTAILDLEWKTKADKVKWKIILRMKDYMRSMRAGNRGGCGNEDICYRGGLGLVVESRASHGISCFRLGLVRETFRGQPLSMNNEELKRRLKILDDRRGSGDPLWKPLKLSGQMDKSWYYWIMES